MATSGRSTQTPPLLILAVLSFLFFVRAATAVATAPLPAKTTITLVCPDSNSASSQAPQLLLLVLLFCVFLLREVVALPSGQLQDASPGYVALPFTKSTSSEVVNSVSRRQIDTPLTPNSGTSYTVDVKIGTQSLTMVVDTGSYDIWVYDGQFTSCRDCSSGYYDPTNSPSRGYPYPSGLDFFRPSDMVPTSPPLGYYLTEDLTIGGVSARVVIGAVTSFSELSQLPSGFLGLAPAGGVSGECSERKRYPGYIDVLVSQGSIEVAAYSIFLDDLDSGHGTIIFGGKDPSKYLGSLTAFPIVESEGSRICALDIQRPTISFTTDDGLLQDVSPVYNYTVMLDTGTPLTFLPVTEFMDIASSIGVTRMIQGSFEFVIDCSYAGAPGGFAFTFSGSDGNATISVPWKELVIPDSRLAAGKCRFGLAPNSDHLDMYIFGETFLRSAYVLYNYENATISLAPAIYDNDCTDCVEPLRK